MIYTVCAYFDTEIEKYFPAILIPQSEADIIEGVTEAALKGKVGDCAHKKLFCLGEFDTKDAKFNLEETPRLLVDFKPFAKDGRKEA